VLEHNRHDLVSLAVLTAHALWLAEAGPDVCREPVELIGLGRCYGRAGDVVRAEQAFALAASSEDHAIRGSALAYLAESQRRSGRVDDAVRTWQRILEESAAAERDLEGHERRAAEALAIHLEHRAKDPAAARRYAESLHAAVASGPARRRDEVAHRIARLDRKIARANDKGGLAAAPLLDE
jgi:tetratricopeptide (TPR) repeat protein